MLVISTNREYITTYVLKLLLIYILVYRSQIPYNKINRLIFLAYNITLYEIRVKITVFRLYEIVVKIMNFIWIYSKNRKIENIVKWEK